MEGCSDRLNPKTGSLGKSVDCRKLIRRFRQFVKLILVWFQQSGVNHRFRKSTLFQNALSTGNLGSARVSRVGDCVSQSRTFLRAHNELAILIVRKDCFGETPKPTRETRALPKRSSCAAAELVSCACSTFVVSYSWKIVRLFRASSLQPESWMSRDSGVYRSSDFSCANINGNCRTWVS